MAHYLQLQINLKNAILQVTPDKLLSLQPLSIPDTQLQFSCWLVPSDGSFLFKKEVCITDTFTKFAVTTALADKKAEKVERAIFISCNFVHLAFQCKSIKIRVKGYVPINWQSSPKVLYSFEEFWKDFILALTFAYYWYTMVTTLSMVIFNLKTLTAIFTRVGIQKLQ